MSWMVLSFSASCSWRPLDWRIRHSHLAYTLFHSPVPRWRTRLSHLENSAMGTLPIYKNSIIPDWFEKMAWYKILIHVLIAYFLRITMSFPYWWCTKHAQLIMGTWLIYKKNTSYNWSKQKNFHLIKYLLTTFIFSFLFNLYLCCL